MRPDKERLEDILDSIEAIHRYTQKGKAAFDNDELVQVWCLRHLEVIGEAAGSISEETRQLKPNIPWKQIVGMRNALIHGYFNVNWGRVWSVIERDLEPLKRAVANLLVQIAKR
jgi:uncharacterized protein with HEPN domain